MFPLPEVGTPVVPLGVPMRFTVTLEVPAGVVTPGDPQPLKPAIAPTDNSMRRASTRPEARSLRRTRYIPASSRPASGQTIPATVVGGGVLVVMVRVTVCGGVAVVPKYTTPGEKLHCVFAGSPEHDISIPPV